MGAEREPRASHATPVQTGGAGCRDSYLGEAEEGNLSYRDARLMQGHKGKEFSVTAMHFIRPLMAKLGFYTRFLQIGFLSEGILRKAKALSLPPSGALLCAPAVPHGLHPQDSICQPLHSENVWAKMTVQWCLALLCPITGYVTGPRQKWLHLFKGFIN